MIESNITKRANDYALWYLDVIKNADLADYAPVKGCMVIKPSGYAIWEEMQSVLNVEFKKTGVENAYFPLLIPESYLLKEADHVAGFAPEVVTVTEAGGKKLEERYVIRPTSETIIYEMFSRWIESYKDLPLLVNQWANIMRWEKRTRLFLRTSEFLWQEGHTAHANREDAYKRAKQMQEVYRKFAEDYLAIPVIAGEKSKSERFAGAETTLTIEGMMQDGKALQMGTSHLLESSFTDAFNIKYLDSDNVEKNIRATSWGVSTRLIGGLIMAHSDDNGLVLPPKIAPNQVVIVPVWTNEEEKTKVMKMVSVVAEKLTGIRIKIDDRDMRPGPRFYEWEKKGVPVRIEVGPKDVAADSVVVVRRDNGEKQSFKSELVGSEIPILLERIQAEMFARAKKFRDEKTKDVDTYESLQEQVKSGFARTLWCDDEECEKHVSEETKATTRCLLPMDKNIKGKCPICGKEAKVVAIFARSY